MRRLRRLRHTKRPWLLAFPLVLPLDGTAPAAADCTYDATSHAVTIQAPPPDIEFVDYRLEVVDGRIEFQQAPCGDATVTNTDTVHFLGLSPEEIADEYLELYLPFSPGFSPEPDGVPEIEIVLVFPRGFGYVDVHGTDGSDVITLGTQGYNLNADEDLDVQISGVTVFDIEGYAGPDRISTAGSSATGSPIMVQHYLSLRVYGFAGRDQLIGGPSKSLLSGGRGTDVLRGGGGNDVLDGIAARGADKLVGGGGRDRCYLTKADSARGCERIFPAPS